MKGEKEFFRKRFFGGFNREDVVKYIAKIANERNDALAAQEKAESEALGLTEEMRVLREEQDRHISEAVEKAVAAEKADADERVAAAEKAAADAIAAASERAVGRSPVAIDAARRNERPGIQVNRTKKPTTSRVKIKKRRV